MPGQSGHGLVKGEVSVTRESHHRGTHLVMLWVFAGGDLDDDGWVGQMEGSCGVALCCLVAGCLLLPPAPVYL